MAALYDPRYDYPDHNKQRFISSFRSPRARSAILSINSLEQAAPALQTGAPAKPRPPHVNPKAHMHSAIGNDPLLQLMAGGNKRRVGPQETLYFYNSLDPAAQQQHASRVDGSHLAKLEKREAMGGGTEYGNLDGTVTAGAGDQNESGDPVDALQEREIARLQEVERMKRINNPLGGYGQDSVPALTTPSTGTGAPQTDKDDVFQSLVKRYLDEGLGQEEAIAKAEAQMEKSRLQLLKENSAELGTFMMDKLGPDGERNYWPYIPFADTELGRNGLVINGFDGEQIAKFGGKNAQDTAADEIPLVPDHPPMGMSFNAGLAQPPALTTQDKSGTGNTNNTVPALTQSTSNTASNGNATRRMTGGYTGNARGSDLPDMQIGLNERLMRMGAAGLAAGGQGSLAQMGAMFGASADVNQANRQGAMDTFKIEETRRQAHAARVAALAASKNKGAGGGDIDSYAARNTLLQLQNAEEILQGFDDFDGVTGLFNWFVSGWDSSGFGDAARENVRLKIAKMKVDSTLARTALTKGAISNSEMEIFTSDQPSFYKSEAVWREWVTNYIRALKTMHTNLATGRTPYPKGGGGGSTGKEVLFTAPNGGKVFAE